MTAGYCEQLDTFIKDDNCKVVETLKSFVKDAGESQIRAWRDSIRILKRAVEEILIENPNIGEECSVILEYSIPLESRRIDALLLLNDVIVVVEFKGKVSPTQADVDQAAAYARDLRAYHRECSRRKQRCQGYTFHKVKHPHKAEKNHRVKSQFLTCLRFREAYASKKQETELTTYGL